MLGKLTPVQAGEPDVGDEEVDAIRLEERRGAYSGATPETTQAKERDPPPEFRKPWLSKGFRAPRRRVFVPVGCTAVQTRSWGELHDPSQRMLTRSTSRRTFIGPQEVRPPHDAG